jgi:hypothetical protein
MSFLQPWMLLALPIASLPVIIHLINQRRFQSIQWAAMRFLLEANRMSRGYARLRQWLILAMRVLAIAALVFVIGRPLATGWLGLIGGGRPDTTIIMLDRSASMTQQGARTVESKLETGVAQLAQTLATLGSSRWILIDSVARQPIELKSPADLLESPNSRPASATADIPALLQAAHDYIKNNRTGQTEIWICSDLRSNDWNVDSGRWKGLRDNFQKFSERVRFHLLAYPAPPAANMSVRVTNVDRRTHADGTASLNLTVRLVRDGGDTGKRNVPVHFDIDGARSEVAVEMVGPELELKNHPISLAADRTRGWGRVSLPADQSPADNDYYFVFDEPPPRHTLLVTEDPAESRSLELAAGSSPDPSTTNEVEVRSPGDLTAAPWETVALVLWQAPLPPQGEIADAIHQFVARGGQIVFFPPHSPGKESIFGVNWDAWELPPEAIRVETWRGDQDLLARTESGAALPLGELTVRRYCKMRGDATPLARLYGGDTLLGRVTTEQGGVYFCAATTAPADASLGTDGVALYVTIQRALAAGAAEMAKARQLAAGNQFPLASDNWQRVAGNVEALSTEYPFHAGIYSAEEQMLGVNRHEAEDRPAVVSDPRVAELFRGLDFDRVDDEAGNLQSLAREIWRVCLAAMIVAMVAEAGLCLPRPARATGGTE